MTRTAYLNRSNSRCTRRGLPKRRGGAAIEYAMTTPLVLLVVLSGIMFCGVLMTQNTMTAAARNGGRIACISDMDSTDTVEDAVEDRLERGGVDPASCTIEISPDDLSTLETGDEISILISVPMDQCTWWIFPDVLSDKSLATEITYVRE